MLRWIRIRRKPGFVRGLAIGLCAAGLLGTVIAADPLGMLIDRDSQLGLQLAPLPLNMRGKSRGVVGYGSYLVNALGECNGCHAVNDYMPGGNPFLGQPAVIDTNAYLRGGRFFGIATSASLRPDPTTGLPGNMTYAQFVAAMRHGTDPENPAELLQVMPWPTYRNMADAELNSIYQYLSALPPAPPWNGGGAAN